MNEKSFGSPYHGNSAENAAWLRGYNDRQSVKPFDSGPATQKASITLAYNQGWRAAFVKVTTKQEG